MKNTLPLGIARSPQKETYQCQTSSTPLFLPTAVGTRPQSRACFGPTMADSFLQDSMDRARSGLGSSLKVARHGQNPKYYVATKVQPIECAWLDDGARKKWLDDMEDCSTEAPSDCGSDLFNSDSMSIASSSESKSGTQAREARCMTRVSSLPNVRSFAHAESNDWNPGQSSQPQSRRIARREESRKLSESRPRSKMLRRRYEQSRLAA